MGCQKKSLKPPHPLDSKLSGSRPDRPWVKQDVPRRLAGEDLASWECIMVCMIKFPPNVLSSDLPQNAVMLVSGSAAVAIAHAGDVRRAFRRRHAVDRGLRQFGRQVGADVRCRRAPVLACRSGSLRTLCRHRRRARVRCTCLPLGFSD